MLNYCEGKCNFVLRTPFWKTDNKKFKFFFPSNFLGNKIMQIFDDIYGRCFSLLGDADMMRCKKFPENDSEYLRQERWIERQRYRKGERETEI